MVSEKLNERSQPTKISKGRNIEVHLVYPSSHKSVQTLYTFNKGQQIGNKPPQSVMILATYLRSKGFPNVHCLDAQVHDLSPLQTAEKLAESNPDVIGLTAWTDFWYPVYETLKHLRRLLPETILLIGGPHASVYPRESLEATDADFDIGAVLRRTLFAVAIAGANWRRNGCQWLMCERCVAFVECGARDSRVRGQG